MKRFWIITIVLAVLAPATAILRDLRVDAIASRKDDLRSLVVLEAYETIDNDLRAIQSDMLDLGLTIAASPIVRQGLDEARLADGPTGNSALVDYISELNLPPHTAVELYTPVPRIVAWQGFSMPLGDAPGRMQFLEGYQTTVSVDPDKRDALVLWVPVRDGPTIYGGVRVLRILRSVAPVQNAYLQTYDLANLWSRKTHLPLRVEYSTHPQSESTSTGDVRRLQGLDGTTLGLVSIDRPSGDQLLVDARDRYDDVVAFWVALFGAWLVAAAAVGYRNVANRAGSGSLPGRSVGARFSLLIGLFIAYRYLLLRFDFPNRLQRGKSPLAPIYDPTHLASTLFGGIMRSIGDIALTGIFAAIIGLLCYKFVMRALDAIQPPRDSSKYRLARIGAVLSLVFATIAMAVVVSALARITSQVILDSTLDFFARSALLPENLVLTVFASLLLLAIGGAVIFGASMVLGTVGYRLLVHGAGSTWRSTALLAIPLTVVFAAVCYWFGLLNGDSYLETLLVTMLLLGAGFMAFRWYRIGILALTLRNVLLAIFWATAIVYPLLYRGLEVQRQNRLVDAVESFDDGRDPRVLFAIDRILFDAGTNRSLSDELVQRFPDASGNEDPPPALQSRADSIATSILRRSLLASMGNYEVSLTVFDAGENPVGRYYEADQRMTRSALAEQERTDFQIMYEMHSVAGSDGPLIQPMTGRRERERFRYQGLVPVKVGGNEVGWVMASAEPRSIVEEAVTPFPRVLVPAGFYGNLQGNVSLAEFRDGVLVRNTGEAFGRYRLSDAAMNELLTSGDVWRRETDRGKEYDTYYHRRTMEAAVTIGEKTDVVVASRIPSVTTFDHLYYLLRLTVAGLFLGIPIYLIGLARRRAAGLLPAPSVRFRDKVLNAFFAVGLITVAAMGFVGLQVVTGENERAIDSWLKQHLERVEKTLFLDAQAGELAYSVMDRTPIDSLAARVGLDLNVYRGTELVASSRPQLVEDRLIDPRLPMSAYKALFFDGFRFVATDEQVGDFTYTAGFRALADEEGRPYYVVSVPTLPEQERIEEERARTVAYLFGALLLLVIVVLVTASVLANALTRPIMRLREGLESVSRGQFSQIAPFESRDEFGELVQTFNSMQDQLADSRRKVAQQERQLAWREMARQVAHEIKNPLTPMKLSVQHLRRSFESSEDRDSDSFQGLFSRITTTLMEQIDALARIANEFSSFARMPQRVLGALDLNAVVREAAALMEAEEGISIRLQLSSEALIVEADREELRRIFINLIKNGIQAVPEERDGKIEIVTRLESQVNGEGPVACAEVIDNGNGIPEALRARIFEPNFSTKTSGTGLGLAIVRKGIEDINGEVGFRSNRDDGTTFWIRLPILDGRESARP